jgi:hypothetical protein
MSAREPRRGKKGQIKTDAAGRANARAWEGLESAVVESEGNMSTNEARMCRKLFHFLNILVALESDRTHVGIATESRDSNHIPPRQSLSLSRSAFVLKHMIVIQS